MEPITNAVGNPTALLIERIFWLGIGIFFGLAIIISLIKGLSENKNNKKTVSAKDLKRLAKKAVQQNSNNNESY